MLRTYFQETFYDMAVDVAQKYAEGIRVAILAGRDFEGEKQKGFFLSKNRGFEDKLYVGNIHRIENHLYWNDEVLADDDQIVNVVVIDGPVTRDGDGCSYGSKDQRDQIMYANTIPQVVGHIFILNTPGGAASARIDYEQAIADCREKGKPTVAWVDGLCCSAGQLVASLCDRTIVMNGRHTMGCIGTMCAFWGVANNTVDKDGYRYIELVSVTSPDKNAEYREATEGKTTKLQAELDKLGEEFRETVRQNRPLVKEERLTGKTFDADEVMGELVDEIGDYNRAIECVFELAGQTLTAARFMTAEEPENPDATEDEPEEIATTKSDNDMNKEEEMAAEVQEAQAAEMKEEVATVSQQTEQEATTEPTPEPLPEGKGEEDAPAAEEAPVSEEPASEEAPATEEPASEASATEEPASEEAVAEAESEIDKITETLHNAEALVEERDKTIEALTSEIQEKDATIDRCDKEIADMKEQLSNYEGIAEERDEKVKDLHTALEDLAKKDETIAGMQATIDKLTAEVDAQKKALADKEAEIKELAGKPAPMVDAQSGIPADNGTGGAPKVNKHQRIRSDMSYEEIRKVMKEQ